MPRVKRGVTAHRRHKKILKQAKGYYGARSRVFELPSKRLQKRVNTRIATVVSASVSLERCGLRESMRNPEPMD